MKKQFLFLSAAFLFILGSCNNNAESDTDVTTDSSTSVTTAQGTASTDTRAVTYYDLQTNAPVEVTRDEKSHQYVEVSTHKPLTFYYDPISRDTFDVRGRLVNNALVLTDGKYTLDEAKVKSDEDAFKIKTDEMKMKMDSDGDMKMKTDDKKIKDNDQKNKEKTDDSKLKVKDDKIKSKED
jgi:hypothetical protein